MKHLISLFLIGLYLLPPKQTLSQNSPVSVSFLREIPSQEQTEFKLSSPTALSIDAEGNIFILDAGANRLVKLNPKGEFIAAVGGLGWNPEEFDQPEDLAIKSQLNIFVADYNNKRIQRYDNHLNFISLLVSDVDTPSDLEFSFPSGIDISRHGELFIADKESDRALKLNSFGQLMLIFGDYNSGEGQIQDAGKIEVDGNDLVYVSDVGAGEVALFDYFGNFIARIGAGILKRPGGVFIYKQHLFVTDEENHNVNIFDPAHQHLFSWGAKGDKIGAFLRPVDIAVFNNQLFVLDADNNRIQIFQLKM